MCRFLPFCIAVLLIQPLLNGVVGTGPGVSLKRGPGTAAANQGDMTLQCMRLQFEKLRAIEASESESDDADSQSLIARLKGADSEEPGAHRSPSHGILAAHESFLYLFLASIQLIL